MTIKILSQLQLQANLGRGGSSYDKFKPGLLDIQGSRKFSSIKRSLTARSKTASKLYRGLRDSAKKIHIVVWRPYDKNRNLLRTDQGAAILSNTCFSSDDPVDGEGTLYWCPYLTFQFREEEGEPWHDAPEEIVLFHELGHAWQWACTPEFWAAAAEKSDRPLFKELRLQVSQRTTPHHERIDDYFPAIEFDNLNRHEWPICDDLGVVKRNSYTSGIRCTNRRLIVDLAKNISPKKKASTFISGSQTGGRTGNGLGKAMVICPHCGHESTSTFKHRMHLLGSEACKRKEAQRQ